MNKTKFRELRITFSHSRKNLMKVNGEDLECVKRVKILGLQISSELAWNNHIVEIVKKVSKHS